MGKEVQEEAKTLPHSRSIELYDDIPKYVWEDFKEEDRIDGKFLAPLERNFTFKGDKFNLILTPARLKDENGELRDYFPGQREEIVEDALRKLGVGEKIVLLDDCVSVIFIFHKLLKELKRMGYNYSFQEVKEALEICDKTIIELSADHVESNFCAYMFETLGIEAQNENDISRCFVRFNFLVDKSVKNNTFKYFNYEKSMSYKNNIARRLFKRMSYHFVPTYGRSFYVIRLSTIINNFGLTRYPSIETNLKEVKKALKELIKGKTLLKYEEERSSCENGEEVTFKLIFSNSFISEIQELNRRSKSSHLHDFMASFFGTNAE